jgi:curved DNA-binding protein CbpA
LLIREAFDVLGLRPGAPSSEIKEAYRDLVKVWHPDRFGSDPRLRQRAEVKLKEINEATLWLRLISAGTRLTP